MFLLPSVEMERKMTAAPSLPNCPRHFQSLGRKSIVFANSLQTFGYLSLEIVPHPFLWPAPGSWLEKDTTFALSMKNQLLLYHCVRAKSPLMCLTLVTLWTGALQVPLSVGFCRQENWSGVPCPPSGYVPDLGIEPTALKSPALVGGFLTTSITWEAQISTFSFVTGYSWNRYVYACVMQLYVIFKNYFWLCPSLTTYWTQCLQRQGKEAVLILLLQLRTKNLNIFILSHLILATLGLHCCDFSPRAEMVGP